MLINPTMAHLLVDSANEAGKKKHFKYYRRKYILKQNPHMLSSVPFCLFSLSLNTSG